jgi:uncharacterized protein YyaL (SSP411 family)
MSIDEASPSPSPPEWAPLPGCAPFPSALVDSLAAAVAAERAVRNQAEATGAPAMAGRPPGPRFTNRLVLEASPYLRQHAHNPVNWYPWGDEAFAEAERRGCPVFLSIGYATCHWCHVMEAESFEDEGIAAFLNEHYVAIKVDREERPDVDAVYMTAVQALTGAGGWPMSVWLNPAREPFFGGTYFPPRKGARGARRGFLELLHELKQVWQNDPTRVEEAARSLAEAIRGELGAPPLAPAGDGWRPDARLIASTVEVFARGFDEEHGGLNRVPKFPSNVPVRLLLRHHARTRDPQALRLATFTLEKMASGGLYDQLAGGFHRYSTDRAWLVPHFEKMLYDNALLVTAYTEAWQLTKRRLFARVVRETCDELLATFLAPEGGFYAATDADSALLPGDEADEPPSHGVAKAEGRFFVWTPAEIRAVLGDTPATALFLRHYGVSEEGNFEGRNILHVAHPDEDVTASLAEARQRLREVRARRPPPFRDEKILASWNGLAIGAFARAGRALGEARFLTAASRAATFVWDRLRDGATGRLRRSVKDDRTGAEGFLDDYAFLTAGFLDLFEATGTSVWLARAATFAALTDELFADPDGGWFMTGGHHERLLARERPTYDGAEPSGNAVAWMNALRLAALTDEARWRDASAKASSFYAPLLRERPTAMTEALLAVDLALGPQREIALLVPEKPHALTVATVRALDEAFLPWAALARRGPAGDVQRAATEAVTAASVQEPFFLRDKAALHDAPTLYICHEGRCERPLVVETAEDLAALAAALSPSGAVAT